MPVWHPKDPSETVAYTADWSAELGDDAIASYTLTKSGTATILKDESSASTVTAWIEGGTNGTTTTFTLTVTTGSGQILVRTYSLGVTTGANSYQPTTTTKRDLIGQAYIECALNGWEYDITPEELDKALTRLDMLAAELKGRGIDLGYNAPASIGAGDLDDALGCADQAFFGLAILMAERLCSSMGKTMKPESRMALNAAMKAVRSAAVQLVPNMGLARATPLGSGRRFGLWPYGAFSQ